MIEFYCPMIGEILVGECDKEKCIYSPCGFKRTGKHTSLRILGQKLEVI